jgi:hypothetical protein
MGVHVDETGGYQQARGVDLLASAAPDMAGLDNPAVAHGNVASVPLSSAAIDDGAATDDKVKFWHSASFHDWPFTSDIRPALQDARRLAGTSGKYRQC